MSDKHPIIAITGSSGNDTAAFTQALERIFYRERVKAVYAPGSAFHRYNRDEMKQQVALARSEGRVLSHYNPAANHIDKLHQLFKQYNETGQGESRYYLHTEESASTFKQPSGTFTPWKPLDNDSDLLLYRGMHGAITTDNWDVAQYPDLLIGVSSSINQEWAQRIQRDIRRGRDMDFIKSTLLDRMSDYARYISPQFSRTHINFQMVPVVDTSDPFDTSLSVPTGQECQLIIHFQDLTEAADFPNLVKRIKGARMTRRDTLIVPGAQMLTAIEIILMPTVCELVRNSRIIKGITEVDEHRGAGVLGMLNQLYQ